MNVVFIQFVADLGKSTLSRLTKGHSLVEILKQFCGSPINLTTQVGILSLANQNLAKALAIKDLQLFLNLYLDLPVWALLFVPPQALGKCLATFRSKQRR